MTKNGRQISRPLVAAALLALALAGCSGGDGDNGVLPSQPPAAGGDEVVAKVGEASELPVETWLARGLAHTDGDGDGIEDPFDPWPDERPTLTDPSSRNSLTIRQAWTEIENRVVRDTAIAGHTLQLEVEGLPPGGSAIWAVFQTPSGFRAAKATLEDLDRLSVQPVAGAMGVHVVAGSLRGISLPIRGLDVDHPVLFFTETPFEAGDEANLEGRNLDRVEHVRLGDDWLDVVRQSPEALTVRLPEAPASNRLEGLTAAAVSNVLSLNLRQAVELSVDSSLELAQNEELRVWIGGKPQRLSPGDPLATSLTAWKPIVLAFDIVAGDSVVSRGPLRTVVWPGDESARITTRSSLLGRMIRIRHLLPGLEGSAWADVRSAAESVLSTSAAQEYSVALAEHVAGRADKPDESLVIAAVDAYKALEAERAGQPDALAAQKDATAYQEPTTVGSQPLDSIIGTTMTYLNLDTIKPDGSREAGYVFPESTSGSDYSQVIILHHGANDLFSTNFKSFSGCEYNQAEQNYATSQNALGEYEKIWRSDLCIQIDGLVYISASVAKPGFRTAESVFNEAALGGDPPEIVRRHTRPSFLDGNYQWGPGGYYLKADNGLPLCHMETCFIEVITSGYGAYKNVPLTASQEQIVDTLRVRMWVEAIVPWILGLVDFSEDDNESLLLNDIDVPGCLRDDLLSRLDFLAEAEKLANFLEANRDKSGDELLTAVKQGIDQKLAPFLRSYVKNELDQKVIECLNPFKSADEIQSGIVDALLEKPSGLTAFLDILQFVQNLGSAVLTPEKFVFKIQYRAEIKDVTPEVIDLYEEDGSLSIDGDWLVDTDPNTSTPCGGSGWCPKLVVRDSLAETAGREFELQLDESHIGPNAPLCGFACSNLTIPYAELGGLQDLVSGDIELELAVEDPDYQGHYPNSALRIPVPGQPLRLKTRAKINAVYPPLAKPGGELLVEGTRFETYGPNARFELRPEQGSGQTYELQKAPGSIPSDSSLRLVLPLDVEQDRYNVVILPDTGSATDGLEPLVAPLPIIVTAGDGDLQLVVVGDHGVIKDDAIRVEFLDSNDNIVSGQRPLKTLSFSVPRPVTPTADELVYVDGRYWDDQTVDEFGELFYITAYIVKVRVACQAASSDKTCTWGIRSLRDKLCVSPGREPQAAFSHKVAEGDERIYYLAPGEAACNQLGIPP